MNSAGGSVSVCGSSGLDAIRLQRYLARCETAADTLTIRQPVCEDSICSKREVIRSMRSSNRLSLPAQTSISTLLRHLL